MSIYVLIEYTEECKENGTAPNWAGLREWKKLNWND